MTTQLSLIYPNVWENYQNANALVNAYYVDWDLLSFLQDLNVGTMSDAFGRRIKLDGPFDSEVGTETIATILCMAPVLTYYGEMLVVPGIQPLIKSHYRSSYLYGLLVAENQLGTIVVDILGYSPTDLNAGRSP